MRVDLTAAALAAHRFGLGEPRLQPLADDPRGWLLAQIGPAEVPAGPGLASGLEALAHQRRFLKRLAAEGPVSGPAAGSAAADAARDDLRTLIETDVRAHLALAATSQRPLAERLVAFWANHFTVSQAKGSARGLAGSFEREAIRPHIAGRFHSLLSAATRHPAMLRYLDNEQSAGPRSRVVQRLARRSAREDGGRPRISGLNENLARELLELHTLGARAAREGVYTQADVTALAAVLTGWRVNPAAVSAGRGAAVRFDPHWHEPGEKRLLGLTVPEGEEGLARVLAHLAAHPATARHVCERLARHLVADEPPPALMQRAVDAWHHSDGDLGAVTRALIEAPEAWAAQPGKLKTPAEFVISTARVLGLGARAFERQPDGGIGTLGQRMMAAPSPAGWPDTAADWLSPDAVWKRMEWASRVAGRLGRSLDARQIARDALGPRLAPETLTQIERAADGAQALTLLLLSPDFQRR